MSAIAIFPEGSRGSSLPADLALTDHLVEAAARMERTTRSEPPGQRVALSEASRLQSPRVFRRGRPRSR